MSGKRGFTLTELAIVIVVMGIVAAFTLPNIIGIADKSENTKAIEYVKNVLTEYETRHSEDYVKDVVLVNESDSQLRIFGYSYDEKILYMFSGASWLTAAQTDIEGTSFDTVAYNIVKSAKPDPAGAVPVYADADGLLDYGESIIDLSGHLSNKTDKKLDGNTLFIEGKIATDYKIMNNGVTVYVRYAEPDLIDENTAVVTYTTKFLDSDGTLLHSFSTRDGASFIAPDDPVKDGEYFKYWVLTEVEVDGDKTSYNIPATALAPGETYDIPNSDVVYTAVYGTENEPTYNNGRYEIYNAAELEWFSDKINDGTITEDRDDAVLMRSFVINKNLLDEDGMLIADNVESRWTPIGTQARPYRGNFDGNGHFISGMCVNPETPADHVAMFGYTQGASIEGLTLKDSYFRGTTYVAALVADTEQTPADGETALKTAINNCGAERVKVSCANSDTVYKEIPATSDPDTGEITAPAEPEGGTYGGGLVGCGMYLDMKGCSFDGWVWGGSSGSAIGGLIGASNGAVTVEKSFTAASVTGVRYVGGIIGKTQNEALKTEVTDCYNNGTVKRMAKDSLIALPTEETDPYYTTYEDYCIAYGGIIGGADARVVVTGCFNEKNGRVTAGGEGDDYATGIGGIIGVTSHARATSSVTSCNNFGTVAGRNSVGGIIGEVRESGLTVDKCRNNATVNTFVISGGGIVGRTRQVTEGKVEINRCTASDTATVNGNKRVGGILGDNSAETSVSRCVNEGAVTETAVKADYNPGVGGIVGMSVGKISISDCENKGSVTSSCQGAGGIVGRLTSATLSGTDYTADGSTITKCANSGKVETLPAEASETPAGSVETPDPLLSRKHTGGIIGYDNIIVTVSYCYNAGYVNGVNNVGGIAGEIAVVTPTPTVEPTEPAEPTEPVEPAEPAESTVTSCYCVGVVEASEETDTDSGTAGAILGSRLYAIATENNFCLKNCVIAKNAEYIVTKDAGGTVVFATEKAKAAFENGEATGVTALLNTGLEEGAEVFVLPPDPEPDSEEEPPRYEYSPILLEVVKRINEDDAIPDVALPVKLPVF